MNVFVKVKVNVDILKWTSKYYIDKYEKYKLKCEVKYFDIGLIYDKYKLKLKGNKENIELFLSYLQRKGFKINLTQTKFTL